MDLERLLGFIRRRQQPLLALGLLVVAVLVVRTFISVLAPFLIALVLAYLLEPLAKAVRKFGPGRFKISRLTSVLVIYILVFGAVFCIGLPVVVNVASGLAGMAQGLETTDLQAEAQVLIKRYRGVLEKVPLPDEARGHVEGILSDPREVSRILVLAFEKLRAMVTAMLRGGAGLLTTFLSAGVQFLLVPLLLFYFMLEWEAVGPFFMALTPRDYRDWMGGFLVRLDSTLGGFVRGQLLIAFLFGTIMTVGLLVIGIPYGIILGPLSGLANMVPYLGVVVGLVPAFFLALWKGGFTTYTLVLCGQIVILFVVLQLLDGYIFQPRILGPSVGLHPLTIMLALAIGENLMGLAGMVLAVPVAAVLKVLLRDLYPLVYQEEPAPPED